MTVAEAPKHIRGVFGPLCVILAHVGTPRDPSRGNPSRAAVSHVPRHPEPLREKQERNRCTLWDDAVAQGAKLSSSASGQHQSGGRPISHATKRGFKRWVVLDDGAPGVGVCGSGREEVQRLTGSDRGRLLRP